MANSIDLIIGQEAIKQVENLISKLSLADAELIKISQSASVAGKGINGISTPSGLDKSIGSTASLNAQLEKQNAIITKLHDNIAKKAEQSRLSEIRLEQQREKAFDSFEKNANKEKAIAEKNANTYNKTQAQINRLTTAYNDLSVRKARYNNLNENEEKRLVTLSAINEKYNGILKQTDATIGKNQRNVGNYASGYNALGNSINQLTREAPAFANSVNTGFMAISNNIPALFDAIKGIRVQNQALASEGKPTVSVLKSLAGALFSWGTLLSVGVTLLTLYGGELIKWASNAMKGKEAIKSLAENQQLLNDSLAESSNSYAEQKVNIDVLYKTATNLNESYKDRKLAVDELQKQYPFYFKNLSDESIMAGNATSQYDLLSKAILTTAQARAAEGILQKRESERLVIEQDNLTEITKKYKELSNAKGTSTLVAGGGSVTGGGTTVIQETSAAQKERLKNEIQSLRDASIKQREVWAKEDAFFIKKAAEGNAIKQTLEPAVKPTKDKITKAKKEEVKRDIAEFQNNLKSIDILANNISSEIERLKIEKVVANAEELPSINFQLEQLLTLKKQLNEIPTAEFKINTPIEPQDIEKVKEMTEAMKGYLNSFSAEFMANSGFSETFRMLNKDIEGFGENFAVTFNAIAESAQEAFNFISNASQQNFDAEYSRLESQKETSLKFAGDSTTAKAKIEADYEKKRKDIANRENKAKQKQAIFNIAIDTAQAIMSAVAQSPLTGGLPFSAIAAAIGAVQIGMVASQKIPQYFDGGTHGGGLAMINDAGGSNYVETVVTPDGKVSQYSGRDVVTNLPAGTEIFTPEQWRDKELQYMLNSKGISMQKNATNNGMTAQEMDIVLSKHFGKIQTNTTIFDKNGIRTWSESNGNKTIQNANRVSRTGLKV
jgi:DNA repair exonuclease SbcCD ATPase subunit